MFLIRVSTGKNQRCLDYQTVGDYRHVKAEHQ
jgi:hypothetical protein